MKIDVKRKRKRKTDYKARITMLKSGVPRIVVRKTNKYVYIQYVKSHEAQDKVILGVNSKELLEFGWPKELSGSLKSISAAYLTGYLAGKRILEKEKGAKAILDMGLARNISASRIYAALNGLVDAGIDIPHNEEVFPSKERLEGKHLKKNLPGIIEKIKGAIK